MVSSRRDSLSGLTEVDTFGLHSLGDVQVLARKIRLVCGLARFAGLQPRERGFQFQFEGEERARPIGEVALSLSFVARDAMRSLMQEATHGRGDLDTSTKTAS